MDVNGDVWRAADLLVRKHGDDAPAYAIGRARNWHDAGDSEACDAWCRIAKAARELLARAPT